jgi:hypothetical protein
MLHPVQEVTSLVVETCIVRVACDLVRDGLDLRIFEGGMVTFVRCGIVLLTGNEKQQ